MTSSRSCSSRRGALLAVAVASALGACAGARAPRAARLSVRPRVALFPLDNSSGAAAPMRDVGVQLEVALRKRGLDVVSGDIVEEFLARHRIRYTGGVDGETARRARDELDVEGILVGSVDLYQASGTPLFALTTRLVSADGDPAILWMDGASEAGNESPGLFNLGLVGTVQELELRAFERLSGSLASFLAGKASPFTVCPSDSRFSPQILSRYPPSRSRERPSVAVLPFVNQTPQSNAGDVISLDIVRTLVAVDWLDVRDPGVVRSELLRHRVVMEGGVSYEAARIALGSMDVDFVVSGYVRSYDEALPKVEFTVLALDTWANRIVWQSSSFDTGNEGVFFFDVGRIRTANALACRMVREVVDGMVAGWKPPARPPKSGGGPARANPS
jgi:TolB-like protein